MGCIFNNKQYVEYNFYDQNMENGNGFKCDHKLYSLEFEVTKNNNMICEDKIDLPTLFDSINRIMMPATILRFKNEDFTREIYSLWTKISDHYRMFKKLHDTCMKESIDDTINSSLILDVKKDGTFDALNKIFNEGTDFGINGSYEQ